MALSPHEGCECAATHGGISSSRRGCLLLLTPTPSQAARQVEAGSVQCSALGHGPAAAVVPSGQWQGQALQRPLCPWRVHPPPPPPLGAQGRGVAAKTKARAKGVQAHMQLTWAWPAVRPAAVTWASQLPCRAAPWPPHPHPTRAQGRKHPPTPHVHDDPGVQGRDVTEMAKEVRQGISAVKNSVPSCYARSAEVSWGGGGEKPTGPACLPALWLWPR